ncbi:hypothetical protein [Exiguobacterium sp. K1]|uniref:hypothetical protein n=1 Tax=Exiguobacterium sp. K1 TaxID=2980105 RepID=UPI00299F26AD|nr:hypothetical protein [Exiguobacterium sp. K1]MDX1260840.1 hypothetical protein [Exiguobacterium sp. K1]
MAETPNNHNQESDVPVDSMISQTEPSTTQTLEPKTSSPLDNDQKKQEAIRTLERINFWIGNCDTKISFALAFSGILIGAFFASSIINGSLSKLVDGLFNLSSMARLGDTQMPLIIITVVVLAFFVLFMIRSIYNLFLGIKGDINASNYRQPGLITNSNLFFGTIDKRSFNEFKNSFEAQTSEQVLDDFLSQIYINSKRCQQKFSLYNKGVTYLIYSTVIFILLNILFLFIK